MKTAKKPKPSTTVTRNAPVETFYGSTLKRTKYGTQKLHKCKDKMPQLTSNQPQNRKRKTKLDLLTRKMQFTESMRTHHSLMLLVPASSSSLKSRSASSSSKGTEGNSSPSAIDADSDGWYSLLRYNDILNLSLIHIWRCRRIERCRSRWSPYH